MQTKFAKFISYIFHPLLIPTITIGLLLLQEVYFVLRIPEQYRWVLLAIVFLSTFLLPVLIVFIYLKMGYISSLHMEERTERRGPLISVAIIYSFAFLMIRNLHLSNVFNAFAFGGALLIFLALLINHFWKISLHMLAVGSMLGLFIGLGMVGMLYNPLIIPGVALICGLVGYSRLKLNAHTQSQVYVGLLMGISFMMCLIIFLFKMA